MDNNHSLLINSYCCRAPRCASKGDFRQCPNKALFNSPQSKHNSVVFCGKHKKSKYRVDQPYNFPPKYKNSNISMSISKKKNSVSVKEKKVLLNELDNIRNVYVKDIRYTLKQLNLSCIGNKNELSMRLKNYYLLIDRCHKDIKSIKFIQHRTKKLLEYRRNRYKGIGFYNKSICNNHEDFFSLENITIIPDKYFFSYRDDDNFVYAFDIRSFKQLIDNKCKNPYNRNDIPKRAIKMMKKRLAQMKKHNISLIDNEVIELTETQKTNLYVTSVFQKIDELNTAAGGTNIDWFLNLPLSHLKIFYKELEDIWNFRAQLTLDVKKKIIPDNNIFKLSVHKIYNMFDKKKLRYIILDEIDKLVSSGETEADRNLGALWVLTALTIVSPDCASTLPWLIQI